ncbi:MAG TPA: alpha-N-arabinofuranosidase [Chthoniobacterales bacterium]|nr:alpha-N-arabinofuranosidase [Chthoniobacterales bacterium]
MNKARIILDSDFVISALDRRLFGAFVEHLGRCVYTGIFEPDHPTADEHGFRQDVLDLVRELGATIIRYPGGNFLSGYNWEDGVGPVNERPTRLDLAWMSTETNAFGTNEFIQWCRAAGTEPMLGVNLGTRGPDEARQYVEYCNHKGGTRLSDLRAAHGCPAPHAVKFWCLGNEMDGPWQICHKTAAEYGRTAHEAAKVMKWVDPTIQLAACGSSHRGMPTFAAWEYEVLEQTFEHADFLSLHMYYTNPYNDVTEFLANIEIMDRFIEEAVAVCDAVAAKRRSPKRMMLSFDEWNVWYKARTDEDHGKPGWPIAPRLIEEIYDLQDALMVGGALITLLNNANRVKAACLAQLVNVIGAIFTEPGGPAWRQTIFHPFQLVTQHAHGNVLQAKVESGSFETVTAGKVDQVLASALHDVQRNKIALFLLNRDTSSPVEVSIDLRAFPDVIGCEAIEIAGSDLLATNTSQTPDAVQPTRHEEFSVRPASLTTSLRPLSWNVLSLSLRPGAR